MASKLGEVLEIEVADSCIKRPAGPMITIELRDISKLPGYIRIPSMAEGSEDTATITQKNLYSGLPNQCKKCRRFGHHARAYNTGRIKPWEGAPTPNPSNFRGENGKKSGGAGAHHPGNAQTGKQLRAQNTRKSQEHTGMNQKQPKAGKQAGHPARPNIRTSSDALPSAEAAPRNPKDTSGSLETDQAMADPTTPPGTKQGKLSPTAKTRPKSPLLEQPNFGYRSEPPHQTYFSVANANPFATLETINSEEEDLKHTQEETGERWVFRAGRKLAPIFISPRKAPPPSPTHTPTQDYASGSRRKRTRSEVHNSFFTSLGISVPPGQEFTGARVWPVFSRERDNHKEILVNVKSNDLPNLPLHIRCMSASEEKWTLASTLEDLTRSVESELKEKILRFSLSLKGCLALEWSSQEDQAKGGWECTILAHINTGLSGINVQKRKNLH